MSRAFEDAQERNIGRAEAQPRVEELEAELHKMQIERDCFRELVLEAALGTTKRHLRAV